MSSVNLRTTKKKKAANAEPSISLPILQDSGLRRQIERLAQLTAFHDLPHAYGQPALGGVIRQRLEDFSVSEVLPFTPCGVGEHLYLYIRKTGQNTRWVAKRLAESAGVAYRDVGFAGLKDRHGVTEQWFSVHLPGRADPSPGAIAIDGVEILGVRRHGSKLRTGTVQANRFRLVIRDLAGDRAGMADRISLVEQTGVPNFFGPQRFGIENRNLYLLLDDVSRGGRLGRESRSFGLSALRSALFNGFLAERVRAGDWRAPLPGEMRHDPATRRFSLETGSPTGLLWGCGENQATGLALAKETVWFDRFDKVTNLLGSYGVRMMRRPLVLSTSEIGWRVEDDALILEFSLGRGAYATSVLREIVNITDAGYRRDHDA